MRPGAYPPPRLSGCSRAARELLAPRLDPRSLMAAPTRSYTGGSGAAGPGSEECGSEEQFGPGEIGQFFLHGYADRLPWTAHGPLIYGGEWPHDCASELRLPARRVVGKLAFQHYTAVATQHARVATVADL